MFKKIILYTLLFVVIGEIMIRVDAGFHLFEDTRVVKIKTDVKITPEYKLLTENKINFAGNNLRVMVIGDSYIAGGGIEAGDRFSQQLKSMLVARNKKYDDIFVLDMSRPSSNTLDNNQTYFHYVDSFKPQVVIIGYNFNDLEGNLNKPSDSVSATKSIAGTNSKYNESFTKKLYNIYKQSKFLDFVFHKLHTELKARGVIFPNSEFDLMLKGYYEDKANWRKSKELLQEVNDDAKKRNIELIVLKFPEINLIEYPALFGKSDRIIKDFYAASPSVVYVDGADIFKDASSKDYMLSKYDGHPNEKAHKKMAEAIVQYIKTAGQ